jgi:hypothetical protein
MAAGQTEGMNEMEYDVEPIAITQACGRLGQANRQVGRVRYSVVFVIQAGEIAAAPFRDGMRIDWTPLTRKMAEHGRKFFSFAA